MNGSIRTWFRATGDRPVLGCGFLGAREIDGWIDGTLTAARRSAFDLHRDAGCGACALLAADAESFRFVTERGPLASERNEWNRVSAIHAAELRAKLASHSSARRTVVTAWSWTRLAGLAAAAALAMAVVAPFVFDRSEPGRFALPGGMAYDARTLPFSGPVEIRAEGGVTSDAWREAGAAYEAGRWDEAARRFEAIANADPSARDAALYGGIALVMEGRYEEAGAPLGSALRLGDEIGASPAVPRYFLGLAALGRGDLDRARTELEAAATAGGPFGAEAEAVLEQLVR